MRVNAPTIGENRKTRYQNRIQRSRWEKRKTNRRKTIEERTAIIHCQTNRVDIQSQKEDRSWKNKQFSLLILIILESGKMASVTELNRALDDEKVDVNSEFLNSDNDISITQMIFWVLSLEGWYWVIYHSNDIFCVITLFRTVRIKDWNQWKRIFLFDYYRNWRGKNEFSEISRDNRRKQRAPRMRKKPLWTKSNSYRKWSSSSRRKYETKAIMRVPRGRTRIYLRKLNCAEPFNVQSPF